MRIYGLVVLALLGSGCGGSKRSPDDLKVTGSPTGAIEGKIHLTIGFSRPMVARDQLNKPVAAPPVTLSPAMVSEAQWVDEKTLVVLPKADLPISTRFTATVPKGTKALDGNELPEAYSFEFFTQRLTASLDVLGPAARATPRQPIRLTFNHDVPLDQVTRHCQLTAGTTRVPVTNGPESPSGPARGYTLVPAADLAINTAWKLSCAADLHGSVGNLGLDKPAELSFHTYGPLAFVKLEPSGKDIVPDESVRLSLEFTNALKPPYQMKLTPRVAGFPEHCHALDDATPGLSCAATLEPQTTYTLAIDPSQRDEFGQALGKPQLLTFHTTDARPSVSMDSGYFVAELKRPVVPVWTRNVSQLQVTAVPITPANFHQLRPLLDWWEDTPADFAKSRLSAKRKQISVTGPRNKWSQHPLGAAELFGGTPGPGMFYLEVGSSEVTSKPFADGGRQKVLVNFTDIGVVTKISGARGLVWATRLSTGKPLPGAAVSVRDGAGKVTWSGTTDDDGVAVLPGTSQLAQPAGKRGREAGLDTAGEHYAPEREGELSNVRIYVQDGADWTMVNPSSSSGLAAWNYNVSVDSDPSPVKLRGFMHTDRGLYRPGEKVHVKGLARTTRLGAPLEAPGEGKKIKVTVDGPNGKTFAETTARTSAFGGFWFDLDLPGDARLGDYVIHARLDSGTFTRDFMVEEYRPATYEVTGKLKDARIVASGTVRGTVSASYFYGAPVRGGKLALTVHSRSRRVQFAGYDEFDFVDGRRYEGYHDELENAQNLVTEDQAQLDDQGNAAVAIAVGPNDVPYDADLLIDASVTAPSNEVISKTFTLPYFRARTYYGIKMAGYFADVGKPQTIQIVGVGPDGKPASGPAKVTITRRDWNCVWEDWGYRGNYQCKDTTQTLLTRTIQLGGGKPTELAFTPPTGGDYWIVVEGDQAKQSAAPAARQLYAWGDGGGSWRSSDSMALEIVADKKQYKAGETATLLLKTDLAEATGLVTIERDGVIESRLITVTPKVKHLTVPITADHAPNVYVSVALVQGRIGDGPRGKPRMRMGIIDLPVRPEDNTLGVSIETDKKTYRPGETVTATVKVTDATGAPASAEVSITASDEGVLSLIGYETPNPIPTFYAPWGLGVSTATQLEYLRDIPGPNQERPAFGGDAVGTIRSRFVSTAVWTPGAVTDASGIATITFPAPDNLTAFRVMALAADRGHRFGSADQRFTVAKPLQLHQLLPRFLNVGDVLQGGVVIHNETGKPGTAIVKLEADRHVTVSGGRERTVAVAKDARVPVVFSLTAARPGDAVLRFSVAMEGETDAVELKLPVRHPSPLRVDRIASGVATAPVRLPIAPPADALAGSAELVVSVDPDGLAGLEDGLADLIHYPYGCLEQTTSQVIPMIAVRDLAEALAIDGLTGAALDRFVRAGLTKIGRHQTPYGGFSLWPGGDPETYYTAYALWGLYLAKQAGYRVDRTRIEEGLEYLRNDGASANQSRPHYNEFGDQGDQAFALYVRALLGDKTTHDAATKMTADAQRLPLYGKAFLARALAVGLGAKDPAVQKLVGELAAAASAATRNDAPIQEPAERDLWAYMSSSTRTSAVVLSALVELDPKNEAIRPLVRTLMKHRHKTPEYDTQSNLYSLLALTAYARSLSGPPPSVTVELAGSQLISGALGGKQRIRVATAPLGSAGELAITPTGEVHYSVEIRYRKTPGALKGEAHGITLVHEYLDEAGKPKSTFQVGDVVRVRLTTTLPGDADHLIISDVLPAGFEAINSRFQTSGAASVAQTTEWGTYREIHDDRVDFASEYSSNGSYVHEFQIRAIAAGRFARPPTVAQLMYEPAINAQTALDLLEIKPR
ncbi:MAG TPA: MG2 domain-containing protein [Kofleriaceae bacterium]|nr:MG2 domain-containing protein [Kofleriaceae bacterium]